MSHRVSKSLFKTASGLVLALGLSLSAVSLNASASEYSVSLNKTKILHLPGPAATVVVGNPDIADISVHSADTLFIIGRGYGITNLIALDEFGQTILNTEIVVQADAPRTTIRILKMGQGRESYNCTPSCLPTPTLGDSNGFQSKFNSNASPINNTSASASPYASGGNNGQMPTALSAFPGNPGTPTPPGTFAGPPPGLSDDQ